MGSDTLFEKLVVALPKAELHLHIEGTLQPQLLFHLSKKNNVSIPFNSLEEVRDAYNFSDLQSFLNLYNQGMSVLQTTEDFANLAYDYTQLMHANNIVYAEPFFDPQGHITRGIPFRVAYEGLMQGFRRGEVEFKVRTQLIFSFWRHTTEEECMAMLSGTDDSDPCNCVTIRKLFAEKAFVAIGLDSSEVGHPPEKFERLYQYCREVLKVPFAVAHAGEEGPPSYIWTALEKLKVARIDHGVSCRHDAELLAVLKKSQMPLTVCPTSNVQLKVFKDRLTCANAVLDLFLEEGLCVTINSDDPAYFGGSLNDNYHMLGETNRLTPEALKQLILNSFTSSFISEDEKKSYFAKVEQAYKEVSGV